MADASARREARRRKILENSQNRLKLITGENTQLNNGVDDQVINNDSTIIHNNEIETFLVNTSKCLQQPQQQQQQHQQHHDHENQLNNELNSLLGEQLLAFNEHIENAEQSSSNYSNNIDAKSSWSSLLSLSYTPYTKRIFIVCLAIMIRLLFIFQMQFCVRDSIIYPFIIAEVTLQFLSKDIVENVSPFIVTALLFSNLPPEQVNRFLRIFRILQTFIQDFSLYFFTFLTMHLCLAAVI